MNDDLDKQYYKIKEVAEMLGLPQSTLRFWEKEFPTLIKPMRSAHQQRYYRAQDIEKLRMLQYLIKDKGLKIDAARTYLRSNPHNIAACGGYRASYRSARGPCFSAQGFGRS